MNFQILLVVAMFFITIPSLFSQTLSPSEREKLLAEIEGIEETVNQRRMSNRKQAVQAFSQASSDDKAALKFYFECTKLHNFERNGKSGSEFRQWQERNEDKLKDKGTMQAFQIQLRYLVLSLRHAEGVELETLMPEIEAILDQIVKNTEDLGSKGVRITRENVKQTIFAKTYTLDQSLKLDFWCFQPGNIDQMYEQLILPYYSEVNREALPALWDKRIQSETFQFETLNEDKEDEVLEKFRTEKLPKLHWQKSVFLYKNGFEESAALTMKNIITSMPDSPLANDRIDELKNLLLGIDPEEEDQEE